LRSVLSLDEKIFDIAPSSQQPSTMLALKLQRQGYTARRMTDHEKSQLNRLVWGELTLAPINTQFFVLSTRGARSRLGPIIGCCNITEAKSHEVCTVLLDKGLEVGTLQRLLKLVNVTVYSLGRVPRSKRRYGMI